MRPEARLAAAADILDLYLAGTPAEQALTNWSRRSRFAGSGDRAAIRDIVFDAIRKRRSAGFLGQAESGRGLVIGLLRDQGRDPAAMMTGQGHALPPLSDHEAPPSGLPPELVALDCPNWLEPELRRSLGSEFVPVMRRLRDRAPLFLRVNLRQATREEAIERLAADGIVAGPHSLSTTALEVTDGGRRLRNSAAYRDGLVEIQDAASQALADSVPVPSGARVLDFCAGGGGKALALAARHDGTVWVHDVRIERMKDIPARAARAGARLDIVQPGKAAEKGPFDVVVADVPCSGSGAWRRQPEAKWRLTAAEIARLTDTQSGILAEASRLVAPGGVLAYMTCSMLLGENEDRIDAFLAREDGWRLEGRRRISPLEGGDGFFLAVLRRA